LIITFRAIERLVLIAVTIATEAIAPNRTIASKMKSQTLPRFFFGVICNACDD